MKRPPTIILKYYLYRVTLSYGFFTPIFTLFLLQRGLNFTQIASLSIVYSIVTIIGEIPTGYIGDRIGRRNSLLLSSFFMTLSIGGFALTYSYLGFVVLYVFWSLSLVFRSGSGDAWLYETLQHEIGEEHFARIRGRGNSVNYGFTVLTILIGGLLFSIDPRFPFVASAMLNGASIFVLFSLPKNPQYEEEAEDNETFTILDALPIIRKQLTSPQLRSLVVYIALFFGVVQVVNIYIQPISVNTLGISERLLGVLYAGFTVASAIVSYYVGTVKEVLGIRGAVLLFPPILGIILVFPVFVPLLALPVFFANKVAKPLMRPIVNQYINDHTESVGRATILSAASMVYALFRLPFYVVGGVVADVYTPLIAIALLGVMVLAGFSVVHLWESPVSDASTETPSSTD
jgi:MFS family permease